ncbi:serine hydrolase domain-containing protein, partial [Actinoplanes sp. NPDC051633]|uniref:serine hydrolase domain-containing protein n=1 Tax=Actinoplanes sp. NPDC051633 TaxID=3155670 RepID=UPI003448C19E
MPLAATLAQVAQASGYAPDDPLVIGVRRGGRPAYLTRGCLPVSGGTVAAGRDSLFYVASLAKQVTAACVALAGLDPESALADHLPELPGPARAIRLRHLIHHTAGLPMDLPPEAGADRTTQGIIAAIHRLWTTPGLRHAERLLSDPPSAGVGEAAAPEEGDPPSARVGEAAAPAEGDPPSSRVGEAAAPAQGDPPSARVGEAAA